MTAAEIAYVTVQSGTALCYFYIGIMRSRVKGSFGDAAFVFSCGMVHAVCLTMFFDMPHHMNQIFSFKPADTFGFIRLIAGGVMLYFSALVAISTMIVERKLRADD